MWHDAMWPNARLGDPWSTWSDALRSVPVDAVLAHVSYEVLAEESVCAKCGRPLRLLEGLIVHEVLPRGARWRATVAARCQGWRRHRHHATVTLASDGLLLGHFRPV